MRPGRRGSEGIARGFLGRRQSAAPEPEPSRASTRIPSIPAESTALAQAKQPRVPRAGPGPYVPASNPPLNPAPDPAATPYTPIPEPAYDTTPPAAFPCGYEDIPDIASSRDRISGELHSLSPPLTARQSVVGAPPASIYGGGVGAVREGLYGKAHPNLGSSFHVRRRASSNASDPGAYSRAHLNNSISSSINSINSSTSSGDAISAGTHLVHLPQDDQGSVGGGTAVSSSSGYFGRGRRSSAASATPPSTSNDAPLRGSRFARSGKDCAASSGRAPSDGSGPGGSNTAVRPSTGSTPRLKDPLEDAVLTLIAGTGALTHVALLEVALTRANPRTAKMRMAELGAGAVGLAARRGTAPRVAARVEASLDDYLAASSSKSITADSNVTGGQPGLSATVAAQLHDAEFVAKELTSQNAGGVLDASEVDTLAALLVVIMEKSEATIAALTAVYSLKALPGVSVRPKGEAAVLFQKGGRIQKLVKQLLRIAEKSRSALEETTESNPGRSLFVTEAEQIGALDITANAYEISASGGHDNAKFTLALIMILLGVLLRPAQSKRTLWLQAVDIHEDTPSGCDREWNHYEYPATMQVKGPWPWGDVSRAAVSSNERQEIAMSIADSEVPVLDRVEAQANALLQQKREQHVFLLGETGVGKSTLGNLLVGNDVYYVDAFKTGTIFPQPHMTQWGSDRQIIWDTPGLNDAKNRDPLFLKEIGLVVDRVQLASAVILIVRSAARLPHSLVLAIEKYKELFGEQLSSVLHIVVNDSSREYDLDEIDQYGQTISEQLSDEVGIELKSGFLLQIPTARGLSKELQHVQQYNLQYLKQDVLMSTPVPTRLGQQTIESLLALRTQLDENQQLQYRQQLLEQSSRQREGLQILLSRADVRKAFYTEAGFVLIQTQDLSRRTRILQVLQQQDGRLQQKREVRITPDNTAIGKEVAHNLSVRKRNYSSRKAVRQTTPEDVFHVIGELELVLIPLTVPSFADVGNEQPEHYTAARPGDKVSQRTLKAIANVLADTNTTDNVLRLVQACMAESPSDE